MLELRWGVGSGLVVGVRARPVSAPWGGGDVAAGPVGQWVRAAMIRATAGAMRSASGGMPGSSWWSNTMPWRLSQTWPV